MIVEVERGGPAHGALELGDVIVAVDGQLIATREGSRRLFVPRSQPVEIRLRRNGAAATVGVTPRVECRPPGQAG